MKKKALLLLIISILFCISSVSAASASSNQLYYNMSNGFQDLSGNGIDGTAEGGVTSGTATGQFGGATNFDGSNDRVTAPSDPGTTFSGNFSVSQWVKYSDAPADTGLNFISQTLSTNDLSSRWVLGYDGNNDCKQLKFEIDYGSSLYKTDTSCGSDFNDGSWHHVVGVRDTSSNELRIYVDGSLESTSFESAGDISDIDSGVVLGHGYGFPSSVYFNGSVDETKLYNKTLSSTEIDNLYSYNSLVNDSTINFASSLSNPNPNDGALGVNDTDDSKGVDVDFSIDYSDPEEDTGTVTLYWANATQFYQETSVSSGSTVSTQLENLDTGTSYEWYVNASDGSSSTQTSNFKFTTASSKSSSGICNRTVICYNFTESSSPAIDYSGFSNFGEWNGDVSRSDESIMKSQGVWDDYSYIFDNDGDYLEVLADSSHNFADESFAVSAWIKSTNTDDKDTIVGKGEGGPNEGNANRIIFKVDTQNNQGLTFEIDDGSALSAVTTSQTVRDGSWHHVMAVRDVSDDELRLYIDGDLEDSAFDNTGSLSAVDGSFLVGKFPGTTANDFSGNIDELKIINRSLDETNAENLYTTNSYDNSTITSSKKAPNVTLESPSDGFTGENPFSFEADVEWYDSIDSLSLYSNFSEVTSASIGTQKRNIIFSGSEGGDHAWNGRPSMAESCDGDLYAAYRNSPQHSSDGDADLQMIVSDDEGRSWTQPSTRLNGSSFDAFPPSNSWDESDIEIITHSNCTMEIQTIYRTDSGDDIGGHHWMSYDNGTTWENRGDLNFNDTGGWSYDEIKPGHGSTVVDGVTYSTTWTVPGSDKTQPWGTGLIRSFDNGETWEYWVNVSNPTDGYADTSEAGVTVVEEDVDASGTDKLMVIMRSGKDDLKTYRRYVYTNGTKVGSQVTDVTDIFGAAIEKPGLVRFDNGLIGVEGRWKKSSSQSVGFWLTRNGKQAFIKHNFSDFGTYGDSGYGDLFERDNGEVVQLTYEGACSSCETDLVQYDFNYSTSSSEVWESVKTVSSGLTNNSLNSITYSFDSDGSYLWNLKASQADGQSSFADQNRTVNVDTVDTTSPTSSDNWTSTGFVDKSKATVELTATDTGGSGVEDIYYRVNGGSYTVKQGSSATVTINTQGNNTLEYYAEDSAGNVEATNTEYVAFKTSTDDGGSGGDGGGGGGGTIDTTPPDTTDNWDVSGFLDKTQAAVSLSATDAGVGVDRIEYQINGNGFTSVSGNSASVNIFTEGNNTLEYYAVDNNGNEEQTNTEYVAFKTSTDDGGSGGDGGDGSQGTVSLQLDSPQGDIDKDGATEINQVFDTTVDVNNSGTLELQISSENQTGFTAIDGKAIGINSDQSQQFSETFKVDYSNISDSKQVSEEISYRLEWQGDDGYSLASSVQKFRYINNIGGSGNNATGLFSGVPSGLGVYLLLVLLLGVLALPLLIKVRLND